MCALGVKCSLSLYLLQNQENEPLIPEVIMSEFSCFPRYCEFLGLGRCCAVNTLEHSCIGNLLCSGSVRFLGTRELWDEGCASWWPH